MKIKFTKSTSINRKTYMAGDVDEVENKVGESLIAKGLAVAVDKPAAVPAAVASAAKQPTTDKLS